VAVLPFVALEGGVPVRAGEKAAELLASELGHTEGLEAVPPPEGGGVAQAAAAALGRARAAVTAAQAARAAGRLKEAEAGLTGAVADYAAGAGALEAVGEVADTWALLAAVQYGGGKDEAAEASLARALVLAPARPLPLAATSPLFAREVERVRRAALAAGRGRLRVESTPAGAPVQVDGVALGTTPLRLEDVPPGAHLWRVRLPGGGWAGGVAEVAAGKEARVLAEAEGAGPAGKVAAALARNRLDAELLAGARAHAQAERAEAVFLGAVRRGEGRQLVLEAFLVPAGGGAGADGALRRLPPLRVDEDLLSAGQQFLALAEAYARGAPPPGEPVSRLPAAAASAPLAAPAGAERSFRQELESGGAAAAAAQEGPAARPAEAPAPRKEEGRQPLRRTPLGKQ
jgi:hypothetical protein